jgi:serpin B
MKKKFLAGVLSLAMMVSALFSLNGCSTTAKAADLMNGIKANPISTNVDLTGESSAAIAGFAVELFQSSASPSENTLISPLSVLCALAMTANGAREETLRQMEQVFGLTVTKLNEYLHAYLTGLPSGDKYKLSPANSIWFRNDDKLMVEQAFLQTNADYYGASLFRAAFDAATLKDINNWVSEKTDGMIEDILDSIPEDAVMYLINALAFDAEWVEPYREDQVRDGVFTTEAGEVRDVEMMYGTDYQYLDDGSATGFLKYYSEGKYAFAALLPNEGISVSDYVASLTGETLMNTLNHAYNVQVDNAIPKFSDAYSVEMSDILKSMGITDAFRSEAADFTGIGSSDLGNIYISRVIHKTYISVNEKGTRAGAATVVEMKAEGAIMPEETKTVTLDRPFVYLLIDCETNLPFFIGTMMDPNGEEPA